MNTPSNYPPGVTGNEEAINGNPEWEAGWNDGCKARLRHQASTANPYPPGSAAWEGFKEGFRDGYAETLRNLSPESHQAIRDAYYRAATAIATLRHLLSQPDAAPFEALRRQAPRLGKAIDTFDVLGRYL